MNTNPKSIHAKLLNIAQETKGDFQDLLNRYGAESFLARLARSPFAERFIFKGGFLLTYLIHTERKTQDLDFSIRQISNKVDEAANVISEILAIAVDDGLIWQPLESAALNHPAMDYPGVRIKCPFTLGKARGLLRMDLALGDSVEARKIRLQRIRYRNEPFMGSDFEVLAYPPETIFAEKLQIAFTRAEKNTRMKDYYDLFKLCYSPSFDADLVQKSINATFKNRATPVQTSLVFDKSTLEQLQKYWSPFLRKMQINDAPAELTEVIDIVNQKLNLVFANDK